MYKPPRKVNKKARGYYPKQHDYNHIRSHSDYEDHHEDTDSEDEDTNDKYCCECPCCRCPWPIPSGVWCVKDACGIVCVVITWCLVLYAEFVFIFVMVLPQPFTIPSFLNTILFNAFAFLALSSHAMAMLTDPGLVSIITRQLDILFIVNILLLILKIKNRTTWKCNTREYWKRDQIPWTDYLQVSTLFEY